jgi:hypothetical protein
METLSACVASAEELRDDDAIKNAPKSHDKHGSTGVETQLLSAKLQPAD